MAESETPSRREEKAVQALISAALHVRDAEVTTDEINPYLAREFVLSAEDEAALKRIGSRPLISGASTGAVPLAELVESEEFMALHRKQPGQGFSPKTEEEIKRKRQELLEKLRKKKGSS
jgi:hypothetical protein